MTKYYTKSNINYGGQEVMPNTEKRLEGWNKDIAKTVHSIIQKEALTSHELYLFVKDLIDQALAEERDRVRGVIEKPLGIVADFVERWNKQDKEKDVAQAIEELLSIKKLNI